jgi:hypothetical protein
LSINEWKILSLLRTSWIKFKFAGTNLSDMLSALGFGFVSINKRPLAGYSPVKAPANVYQRHFHGAGQEGASYSQNEVVGKNPHDLSWKR